MFPGAKCEDEENGWFKVSATFFDSVANDGMVTVISDFKGAKASGAYLSSDNFVAQINFNYSGKLPAKASIRILVGPAYAGKTLYYSQVTAQIHM